MLQDSTNGYFHSIDRPFILQGLCRSAIGSVRSGYPVEGAAALGFRAGILRSSSGVKCAAIDLLLC